MTPVFKLDAKGGFTVGDRDTGATVYSYPTSEHATAAKRDAQATAEKMLAAENAWRARITHTERSRQIYADCDARNWRTLNGEAA